MILVVLGIISFLILAIAYWNKLNIAILVPIILFFLLSLFKVGMDFAKYGVKGALKGIRFKDRLTRRKEILYEMIQTIPVYHQIVITTTIGSDFLYLGENGFYLFKMIDLSGTIQTSNKPEFWTISSRMDKIVYPNVLMQLKKEAKEWTKLLEANVQPFMVLASSCNYIGTKDPEVIIEQERNFIYELEQQKTKKNYTKEQINTMYQKAILYSAVK